jgi:hypothetical protein
MDFRGRSFAFGGRQKPGRLIFLRINDLTGKKNGGINPAQDMDSKIMQNS